MPTPKKGPRHGGSAKHHNMIVANLATELFRHGRIRTTKSKAKTMQPVAERMVTFAKRGDLHARRQVLTVIRDKDVVHKLFADIGPAAADRNGGYTRITSIGSRKGDNAPMALIELVDILETEEGDSTLTEAPRRRWSLRRRRNNMSRAARDREEAILAAEDAGEEEYLLPEAEATEEPDRPDLTVPADQPLTIDRVPEQDLATADHDDSDGPEVRPEDVEARFAADDATDAAADDASAVVDDTAVPTDDVAVLTDDVAVPADDVAALTDDVAVPADDVAGPADDVAAVTPVDEPYRSGEDDGDPSDDDDPASKEAPDDEK